MSATEVRAVGVPLCILEKEFSVKISHMVSVYHAVLMKLKDSMAVKKDSTLCQEPFSNYLGIVLCSLVKYSCFV